MNKPHTAGQLNCLHIAKILDNQDPDNRGRVKVQLQTTDMEFWAPAMAASAGQGYGISFLPRKDELVVLTFISPDFPIILGALWSGSNSQPEDSIPVEERYAIKTPKGLQMIFDDENGPRVEVKTPNGYRVQISEENGGQIHIDKGTESIKLSNSGINIQSSNTVSVSATQVEVNASLVKVNAGMSRFSGVVQCDTLISNSVVSSSYTPGAGNLV